MTEYDFEALETEVREYIETLTNGTNLVSQVQEGIDSVETEMEELQTRLENLGELKYDLETAMNDYLN